MLTEFFFQGSDAEGVQVSIYRDAPRDAAGPVAGNADVHEFFYVVLVQTKKSDLDVDGLRAKVAQAIQHVVIPGVTVVPALNIVETTTVVAVFETVSVRDTIEINHLIKRKCCSMMF